MRRMVTFGVVWLIAAMTMGQSLGELAKRERKRRAKNSQEGAKVRELTEIDIYAAPPLALGPSTTSVETVPTEATPPETGTEASSGTKVEPASDLPIPAKPSPAPPFTLEDRSGRKVSLAQLRGRPVVLDFWATWCGPCRSTMPEVEKLHRKYRGKGLQVVGINIEGKSQKVIDYLNQSGYSFTVLFDSGNWKSEVAKQYQVSSIPRTFLIDRNGNVVFSGHPNRLSESLIESTLN